MRTFAPLRRHAACSYARAMRSWILAALLASSAAQANPITVGAGVGITQSEAQAK